MIKFLDEMMNKELAYGSVDSLDVQSVMKAKIKSRILDLKKMDFNNDEEMNNLVSYTPLTIEEAANKLKICSHALLRKCMQGHFGAYIKKLKYPLRTFSIPKETALEIKTSIEQGESDYLYKSQYDGLGRLISDSDDPLLSKMTVKRLYDVEVLELKYEEAKYPIGHVKYRPAFLSFAPSLCDRILGIRESIGLEKQTEKIEIKYNDLIFIDEELEAYIHENKGALNPSLQEIEVFRSNVLNAASKKGGDSTKAEAKARWEGALNKVFEKAKANPKKFRAADLARAVEYPRDFKLETFRKHISKSEAIRPLLKLSNRKKLA